MAQRRVLDVPGDERRYPQVRGALRLHIEPQLRRTPGARRSHPSDEPADGRAGCGRSREHAVWALREYGFRAILAPSFADIFYANCCQNGVLAVRLRPEEIAEVLRRHAAAGGDYRLSIDLETQRVADGRGFAA